MSSQVVPGSVRQRITVALFVSQSLFSAAMIAAFTLMPIIAADLSGNDSMAGIPSTLTLLGRAAAAYPIGWLMDKAGRRAGLSTGFVLGILGALLMVVSVMSRSFFGFGAGALLMGMGRGSSDQSRYVAAEIYPVARRAKVIGLIVFAGTIGAVGGPAVVTPAGGLAQTLGLAADAGAYLAGAGFLALALLIVFVFLRPDPREIGRAVAGEAASSETDIHSKRPLRQIFGNPVAILAVASMIIGQLVMALIMVITSLHMHHHDHGTEAVSFVIMAHTLGMFGLSSVTGWLIDRFGRIPLIAAGSLVLIAASLLTPLSVAVPPLAFALFLLGLGWNFCFIAGSSLLADSLAPAERGRAQGASEMLVSLAAGSGSLGSGLLYDQGGIAVVAAVGLACTLALVVYLVWFGMSRRLASVGQT